MFNPTFGRFLAHRREALQLTQAQVAERCLLTPEAISMFENGRRRPSLETLLYLAQVLELDPQAFCRFALENRPPEFYAALGLEPVEEQELDHAGQRLPMANPLLEDDDEEEREGSDWTERADGPALLDIEGSPESAKCPC
ncbi:MAG: helix-turn-helix domain-containing protein [Terriglobia bacterium]